MDNLPKQWKAHRVKGDKYIQSDPQIGNYDYNPPAVNNNISQGYELFEFKGINHTEWFEYVPYLKDLKKNLLKQFRRYDIRLSSKSKPQR